MHELSIALNIVDIAQQAMQQEDDSELVAIHLRLGPMSGVVREALESAYPIACESVLPGSKLVIEETELRIDCPRCGEDRAAVSLNDLRCVDCGSPARSIVRGKELEITFLEVKDHGDDTPC